MDPFSSNPSSKCITDPDLIIELIISRFPRFFIAMRPIGVGRPGMLLGTVGGLCFVSVGQSVG